VLPASKSADIVSTGRSPHRGTNVRTGRKCDRLVYRRSPIRLLPVPAIRRFASENLPTAGRDVEVSRTGQPTFFFSRNGLSSFMCGVFLPTYTIPWYPISAKPIHQNQKDMTSRWDRTNPCTARWTSSRAPWRRSQAASDEVLHVHCDASSSA